MSLTELQIRSAKVADKPYRCSDGRGLYLLIQPNGAKWWRWDYRRPARAGRNTLSLGVHPEVSLKLARERCADARKLLASGIDPAAKRLGEREAPCDSFEAVAREWFSKHVTRWAKSHSSKIISRLENDIFPWLGSRPIQTISAPDVLICLRRIESRGAIDTVHRAHQNCGQVFRYAVATGRAERDPSADLRGAFAPALHVHYPSITDPSRIGELLRAIDAYQGSVVVRLALRLAPLVFVRPGELRAAEWSEINLQACEWRIPAGRMKSRVQHIVPLATQAVEILKELFAVTGKGRFLFPSVRSTSKRVKPMSENTINVALRALGYSKEQMTGHGFRSMASTFLNESGQWDPDIIEIQLAHGERNEVRAAYNYATHLAARRRMMQFWGDSLDEMRSARPAGSAPFTGKTCGPC